VTGSHFSPGVNWHQLRQRVVKLVMGGDWVLSVPAFTRWNLGWLSSDSLFASASENIIVTYLSIYALALGATGAQIGIYSSVSGLASAAMLVLGAALVERIGRRKDIVVFAGGWMARLSILLITLLPLLLKGEALIVLLIGLAAARDAFNQLGSPAWTSLVGDIVPIERRGIYFGSRNIIMGAAGMITVLFIGELITRIGPPTGYQVAMGVAFIIGMVATYSYTRIRDPHPQPLLREKRLKEETGSLASAFRQAVRLHPGFAAFSFAAIVWSVAFSIAGPFFTVFMVQALHVTPTMVSINSVAYAISSMLAQLLIRRRADRIGARRIQLITGLLIPILPFFWLLPQNGWQIIPINIASGILWGIYNLASFTLMFELTPVAQRARYSAIYQLMNMVAMAAGAAVGGVMVTHWGFAAVFIVSGLGRFLAAGLFAWLVHTPPAQDNVTQPQEVS
jgi:MFS family permease